MMTFTFRSFRSKQEVPYYGENRPITNLVVAEYIHTPKEGI